MAVNEQSRIDAYLDEITEDRSFQAAMVEEGLIHTVALRTLEFRKELGLSQGALADLVGTKQPAIARIESGESNVTLRTLAQLAFALERFPEDLVCNRAAYRPAEDWARPRLCIVKGGASGLTQTVTTATGFSLESIPKKAAAV